MRTAPCVTPLDLTPDHRHRSREVLAGQRGKRQACHDTLPDANGVALECVHGQPQRREVADAERRCGRIEHLTHHGVRSMTEPPTGDRRTNADDVAPSPSSVGGSTPNAAIAAARRGARPAPQPTADSASCTSRSGTIFSAARPRLRSSAASASFSRALAERYSARARPSSGLVSSASV